MNILLLLVRHLNRDVRVLPVPEILSAPMYVTMECVGEEGLHRF